MTNTTNRDQIFNDTIQTVSNKLQKKKKMSAVACKQTVFKN